MKIQILGFLLLLISAGRTPAGIGIHWYTEYGAYDHLATDVTGPDHLLLDSHSAIWQLIYAGTDDIINPPDPANSANGWVSGDDVVWITRSIPQGGGTAPEDGTQWNSQMIPIGGYPVYENLSWNTAGFAYQRVYEGSPAPGSWYYDNYYLATLDLNYTGDPMTHLPYDYNADTPWAGLQTNQQIPIPEPTTMVLLAFGTLVMAIQQRHP